MGASDMHTGNKGGSVGGGEGIETDLGENGCEVCDYIKRAPSTFISTW
jgi:hypothetical protein